MDATLPCDFGVREAFRDGLENSDFSLAKGVQ
jgi:hypothetical protein